MTLPLSPQLIANISSLQRAYSGSLSKGEYSKDHKLNKQDGNTESILQDACSIMKILIFLNISVPFLYSLPPFHATLVAFISAIGGPT